METRFYAQYKLRDVADVTTGKRIEVSRAPVHGPLHKYVTVPFNVEEVDPEDPAQPSIGATNIWSFLYGPTRPGAMVTAHLRVANAQPKCNLHLCLYKVRIGSEAHVWASEAPEKAVSDFETDTSNTHQDAAWQIPALAADERLRLQVDYWNATDPDKLICYMVGATVEVNYWRAS